MKPVLNIWPYIELAKNLIKKQRRGVGNMFRHQLETFAILLEFGYDDPVLLKAALIHDLFEDGERVGFTHFEKIISTDHDGPAVYDLVNELTIRVENGIEEPKTIFLHRIMTSGTQLAKILKIADRLSNINTLFSTNDKKFIIRYRDETWKCIMPFVKNIDIKIAEELESNLKKLESIT